MKPRLIENLICPGCGGALSCADATERDEIESGALRCNDCGRMYPIVNGIPRFVSADNYAANFGFQWNEFPNTQVDSRNGTTISRDRFMESTRWTADQLRGKLVLDAGCGSGRFSEIALDLGARVIAIDYSSAVDASRRNLGAHPRLDLVQADIYALPFRPGTFDFVYSLGVIQHTPDVRKSVLSLAAMVKPGGEITVDVYEKSWRAMLHPKYWLRPFTTRMPQQTLFALVKRAAPRLLKLSRFAGRVPAIGALLRRLIPVANYERILPLSDAQLVEWAILDTFDWFSPRYDNPQNARTLKSWFLAAGLSQVDVRKVHHLTARAVRERS